MRSTEESKEFNRKIGQRIKKLRVERDWTQEELATKIDATFPFISNLERGGSGLNAFNLLMLCKALEVAPNQLLMWDLETENETLKRCYVEVSKLDEGKQDIVIAVIRAILDELDNGLNVIK